MENNNRTEEQLPEIKNYFENSVLFSTWSTIVLRLVVLVYIYIYTRYNMHCWKSGSNCRFNDCHTSCMSLSVPATNQTQHFSTEFFSQSVT